MLVVVGMQVLISTLWRWGLRIGKSAQRNSRNNENSDIYDIFA